MNTKGKILLVDDERELRECLSELLEDEGYQVVQAENGLVALDILKKIPEPCVIILDYMMPIMDGKMFCESLRQNSSYDSIPIILLSAANIPEDTFGTTEVTEVLEKPINIVKFLKVVEKFCRSEK